MAAAALLLAPLLVLLAACQSCDFRYTLVELCDKEPGCLEGREDASEDAGELDAGVTDSGSDAGGQDGATSDSGADAGDRDGGGQDGGSTDGGCAGGFGSGCLTVEPLFPLHGRDWNDYVTGATIPLATDTACPEGVLYPTEWCLHGGERRAVLVPGLASCGSYQMRDELGAFEWRCDASASPLRFVSTGLRSEKGLRDLLVSLAWRPDRVTLSDGATDVGTSPLAAWWGNEIAELPVNDAAPVETLDQPGVIYVLQASRATNGYNVNADRIGLVTLEGAVLSQGSILTDNADWLGEPTNVDSTINHQCSIAVGSQGFVWIEAALAGPAEIGLFLVNVAHAVVRHTLLRGFANGLLGGQNVRLSRFHDLAFTDVSGKALGLNYGSNQNVFTQVRVFNSTGAVVMGTDDPPSMDNTFTDLLVVSNGDTALWPGSQNTYSHLLLGSSGSGRGLTFYIVDRDTVSQAVVVNDYSDEVYFETSTNHIVSQLATAGGGLAVTLSGSSSIDFRHHLLVGGSCSVSGGTNPGLVGGTCATQGSSTADVVADVDLSSSFAGPVLADAVNLSGANGAAPFGAITDWFGFENRFRTWGLDGGPFPDYGRCASGTCRIWDWRLRAADTVLRERSQTGRTANAPFVPGAACPPAVHGDVALTDQHATPNTYLVNAVEIIDGIGDDDGLCESGEECLYSPNFGIYQGEGDPRGRTCVFQDGTVRGVVMLGYPVNGR